ncbi:MAG: FkbM family methyltransferase [Zavarzinella sp.]|nr:FkbM family methyltransferase [Zavarzinella sp.]
MFVDIRDEGIGQKIHDRLEYEPRETAVFRRHLRPGGTVVDIGANIGYFAVLAAGLVGQAGRVIAVEPEEYNFRLLRRNIRANRLSNVTPVRSAVGAEPGTATIYKSAANYGDHRLFAAGGPAHRAGQRVPIEPLDAILERVGTAKMVDFIKIDVQGYEHHVVRGMTALFRGDRHLTILTEFWPYGIREAGGSPEEYLETFADAGFAAFLLEGDGTEREVPVTALPDHVPPVDPTEPDGSYINVLFRRT